MTNVIAFPIVSNRTRSRYMVVDMVYCCTMYRGSLKELLDRFKLKSSSSEIDLKLFAIEKGWTIFKEI
jgi:hypothetical protein